MAFSSRIRPTVVRLIGLPSSVRAAQARSPSDWRLRGVCVRATRSQARAATRARSRGGKRDFTPSAGLVLQVEPSLCPALPPEAHGVGMQLDSGSGFDA